MTHTRSISTEITAMVRSCKWLAGVAAAVLVAFGAVRDGHAAPCIPAPSNLVSWWPGDGNATDIVDGNHGTLVSGATFDSGLVNQAFRFNGALNSGVRVTSSGNLNPTEAITLKAWVFPFSFPNGAPSVLRRQGNSPTINNQYLIAVGSGTPGVAHCNIGDFANPVGGSIPLNQWTHVACTYDRQFARLYVNGLEVAAQPRTQPIPASSRNLWIGNWEFQSNRQFDGLIDEVAILNRALTAAEVQAIHAAGADGICKSAAPTADAGTDQSIHAGEVVTLDGSGSFDDDTPTEDLLFAWTLTSKPQGSSATLTGADTTSPSFGADLPGEYVATLVVTDAEGQSSTPDSVVVSSLNAAPVADAGADLGTFVGVTVALDGSASQDPDGDALEFSWTLAAPAGSMAALAGEATAFPTFTPDVPGTYTAALTVTDPFGGVGTDSVVAVVVTPESFAESRIMEALNLVGALQPWQVTTPGNQKALQNFLGQAIAALQAGDLDEAVHKVTQAIERTDGCVLRGSPDGNGLGRDWITDCAAQTPVYEDLTAALGVLTP